MSPNIIEIFDPPPSLDAVVQRFNVKTRKLGTKGNQSFTDFCIAGAEEITKASGSEIAYLPAPCGSLNSIIKCNHPLTCLGIRQTNQKRMQVKRKQTRQMKSY